MSPLRTAPPHVSIPSASTDTSRKELPSVRIPKWSAALSVCNPLLDEQHITLLELARGVLRDIERQPPASDADLRIALRDIHSLACRHVAQEEVALLARGSPDLDEYRLDNQVALERLTALHQGGPGCGMNRRAVADFLVEWMTRHLTGADLSPSASSCRCPKGSVSESRVPAQDHVEPVSRVLPEAVG